MKKFKQLILNLFKPAQRVNFQCPVCFMAFVVANNDQHDYVEKITNLGGEDQGAQSEPMCIGCTEQRRRLTQNHFE